GEAPERRALALIEQRVAPVDGRAERPLALRRIAASAGEKSERALRAFEDLRRREQLRARGGELDGERKPVEAAAQVGDGLLVVRGDGEVRRDRTRALDEQLDRVVEFER